MSTPAARLAALSDLERRFNGPIPEPLRRVARLGSAEMVDLLEAEGQSAFFGGLFKGQIAIIRQRRANGSFYPALLADLLFYRDHWRYWRNRLRRLRNQPDFALIPTLVSHAEVP